MENIKETIRNIIKEESEYQQFFRKALEKAGKSIPDMSDEEKKAFFNKIDTAWDGKGEKNEGNAFGAAVTKAKEEGDDEFSVGGKTYPVKESVNDIKPGDVVSVTRKDGKLYKDKVEKTNPLKIRTSPSDTVVIGNNMIKSVIKESVNEYDEWKNTRIQSKNIFRMLKQKYNNNISKMKDGLELILKQNKTKNDQAEVIRDEFNKFFKIKTETVNENFSNDDIAKIKGAVENASSFMGIGSELKKLGMKYDFSTSPLPVYMIKKGSKTFVLVNKKYAEKPDFVVGTTAGGLLEGKLNENKIDWADFYKMAKDTSGYNPNFEKKYGKIMDRPHVADAIKTAKDFKSFMRFIQKFENINEVTTVIKTKDGKLHNYPNFKKNDVINFLTKKGMNHVSNEKDLKSNMDFYIVESVNETKFKSGDKVIISHPTLIKPFKAVVAMTMDVKGEELVSLKNNRGVWDAKFAKLDESAILRENIQYSPTGYVKKMVNAAGKMVKDITLNGVQYRYNPADKTYNSVKGNESLHKSHILGESVITEGNAFGMAVTAAKKEGKKEFEFNGKIYKVKKGSYEKNEAANPINKMKERTFVSGQGTKVTTNDKAEIKKMKACGWKEMKPVKQVYAKGLVGGKNYLN
jgi:hypothetical protein